VHFVVLTQQYVHRIAAMEEALENDVGSVAAVFNTPAIDGSDGWAAANHRQVPLKKHDGEWVGFTYGYYGHYECCWCTDKRSAYCCTPTSPTQNYIKEHMIYNGSGDQTSESSYNESRTHSRDVFFG
jgi:hypothetical protein